MVVIRQSSHDSYTKTDKQRRGGGGKGGPQWWEHSLVSLHPQQHM